MPQGEYKGRTAITASSLNPKISWAISEKGAVSVYGFGRWPVTMYAEAWRAMGVGCEETTSVMAELIEFIGENEHLLAEPVDNKNTSTRKDATFTLGAPNATRLGELAQAVFESGTPTRERAEYAAKLMTIKGVAEKNAGKVSYDELVFAMDAIRGEQKPAPNPANASQTE